MSSGYHSRPERALSAVMRAPGPHAIPAETEALYVEARLRVEAMVVHDSGAEFTAENARLLAAGFVRVPWESIHVQGSGDWVTPEGERVTREDALRRVARLGLRVVRE